MASKTLYVGFKNGTPNYIKLKQKFANFGSCKFSFPKGGKPFCFVTFIKEEDAVTALQLNNSKIDETVLTVEASKSKLEKCSLRIVNIPKDEMNNNRVTDFFSQFGNVTSIFIDRMNDFVKITFDEEKPVKTIVDVFGNLNYSIKESSNEVVICWPPKEILNQVSVPDHAPLIDNRETTKEKEKLNRGNFLNVLKEAKKPLIEEFKSSWFLLTKEVWEDKPMDLANFAYGRGESLLFNASEEDQITLFYYPLSEWSTNLLIEGLKCLTKHFKLDISKYLQLNEIEKQFNVFVRGEITYENYLNLYEQILSLFSSDNNFKEKISKLKPIPF